MKNFLNRFTPVLFYIIIGFIIVASILSNLKTGIILSSEPYKYLTHYLGPKPVLQKIFDFRGNDTLDEDLYRGRDAANVFNYIDSEFVLFGFYLGEPGLLSVVHYIGIVLFSFMFIYFLKKIYGQTSDYLAPLLLMIFLTSPAPFMTGVYFRTSKIIVSLVFAFIVWLTIYIPKKKTAIKKILPPILFASVFFMAITDEIGIAMAGGVLVIVFLAFICYRNRAMLQLTIWYLMSIVWILIYRTIVSPGLIYSAIGIMPHLMSIDIPKAMTMEYVVKTVQLFFTYIGLLFGNTGFFGGLVIYMVILFLLITYSIKLSKVLFKPASFFLLSVYLLGTLLALITLDLMVATLPPITQHFTSLAYYPIPFDALFIVSVTLVLFEMKNVLPNLIKTVPFVLMAIIFFNIISLPDHFSYMLKNLSAYRMRNVKEIVDPINVKGPVDFSYLDQWPYDTVATIRQRLGR